jgi:hypothetical protein
LDVQVEWEDRRDDDWTEARKKQNKRPATTTTTSRGGRERGVRKALAGTGNDGKEGKDGRRERRGKRGSRKRDHGVRDMKPRPCHTYYLSECLSLSLNNSTL